MMRRLAFMPRWVLVLVLASAAGPSRAATAPEWFDAAAHAPITVATKDADAVTLLAECFVDIGRDGDRTVRRRRVVKILNADGKKHAAAVAEYLAGSSEVASFKAWLIKPNGQLVALGKKEITDVAVHVNALELYGEARMQMIRAVDEAAPGSIFGAESVVKVRTTMNQFVWHFQGPVPTERTTFSVRLAPGWSVSDRMFNHAPLAASTSDTTRTWTLTGLAPLSDEPMGPPARALGAWLALDFLPPPNSAAARDGLKTGSWLEISRQISPRYDEALQPDQALRARVDSLLAGVATPWERMQRLSQFVQRVNYISITLDAANAGGLIPRPAPRVLQCNYGDCKDKATLLRALLAVAGFKSYPLIVAAHGRQRIPAEWPSPTHFNHCILAIAVDGTVQSAATLDHPVLGRLLIFDATDQFTPLGLLGRARLADQALILAGEQGGLVELPAARPDGDRLVRTIHATLDSVGNVVGRIEERFVGFSASAARAEYYANRGTNFQTRIEKWLGATLPTLRDVKLHATDRFPEAEFTLEVEFLSAGYGKLMRDELLTFKPALVSRRDAMRLTKKTRTLPIALRANAYEEHAEFTLPVDCEVDETAEPVECETDFGRYRATTRREGRTLIFERSLELKTVEIPASDYERVRRFFDRVTRSEQSPVVLRRLPAPATAAATGPTALR